MIRGRGKHVEIGDFVVVRRAAGGEVRGVLLRFERCAPLPGRARFGLTSWGVLIQCDPCDAEPGYTCGPTSFYWHRDDRFVAVASGYTKRLAAAVKRRGR